MKFILGEKIGMTQIFDEEGRAYPATVIKTGDATVTQVKTQERDGYTAIQVGYGKTKKLKKPQTGHLKDLGGMMHLKETKVSSDIISQFKVGDKIKLDSFTEGDKVSVSAISKSKGFQGVVKRHGFAGGPRTHGQKHSEREPGSIGIGGVQRVFKGKRMAGRMGGERITVKNLSVVSLNTSENYILIGGAIPGRRGTLVEIRGSIN